MNRRLLLVEDDPDIQDLVRARLSRHGYEVVACVSAEEASEHALEEPFDAVIVDLRLPGMDGAAFCSQLTESRPNLPVIVVTAYASTTAAVNALRAGAQDFVTKPLDLDQLVFTLDRAIGRRRLREEVQRLRELVFDLQGSDEIIGESGCIRQLRETVRHVAATPATVLVTGESGTGKELIARALHRLGGRSDGPLVCVNAAALPEQLVESELFGHVKGAFTGAHSSHPGLFLSANGGTLFLDEIGDLPLPLQSKLLRALEERRIRPVGSHLETAIDVRVVAATHRDLSALVREGLFRRDLFYRLHVIDIEVPPLRARGNDVLLLAQHFLQRSARAADKDVVGLLSSTAERLLAYPWPGNVRELQNAIERAVVLSSHDKLAVEDLPPSVRGTAPEVRSFATPDEVGALPTLEAFQERYVEHVLASVGGNKTVAARILGLSRKTLQRRRPAFPFRLASAVSGGRAPGVEDPDEGCDDEL